MPVIIEDDESNLVKFNLGTDNAPATLCVNMHNPRVTLEPAAQILIKKKMIELGFVHTGWGPDRGQLQHRWWSCWEASQLYDEAVDKDTRKLAQNYLEDRVKEWSNVYKHIAAWTNTGKFCQLCGTVQPENREGQAVVFAEWAHEQAGMANWNGELVAPGDIFCASHLVQVIKDSKKYQKFTQAEKSEIIAALPGVPGSESESS